MVKANYFKNFRKKFLYAAFPCGILSFMYFYFGPTELAYANQGSIEVGVLRTAPYFILSFVLVTLVLTLAVSLCSGAACEALTKLVLGLAVASYVQANFLNSGFSFLDGTEIQWNNYMGKASYNLLIWAAIIAGVYILARLCKTRWATVCRCIALLLFIMQVAGLAAIYANPVATKAGFGGEDVYYQSNEQQYDVSTNENVIVFILDAASNRALQNMTADYDGAIDDFKDFTNFQNCAPSYYGTFPEVIVMLTGNDYYDPNKSWRDFIKSSWTSEKSESFYDLLARNGYERNVFNSEVYISDKYQLIKDKIDNSVPIEKGSIKYSINAAALYSQLERLTLYRYFPIAMKACYWSSDTDYEDIVSTNDLGLNGWSCEESLWYSGLKQKGLNTTEANVFSVYHFWGAHEPCFNNEFGEKTETHHYVSKQLCGSFHIIADYLKRLKDIGVYDSSTIIIMADHGDFKYSDSTASSSAIFLIKRRNETHEEMAVSNAPITHLELIPTIAAEVDPSSASLFGETVFTIKEDAVRDRTICRWAKSDKMSPGARDSFYKFTVPSDINDLNDLTVPEEVIMLKDYFY